MSFRRTDGPADRAGSERLLDAARAGRRPSPDADPLVQLLAAAAAPANPGELSGEGQALAAFRAARAAPAPVRAARRRRIGAGAVAWLAGLAATATAGAAFAAVSLDRPEEPAPPSAPTTPGSSGADGSQSQTPGGGTTGGGPRASPSTAGAPSTAGGGPGRPADTQQLTGLCRAYLAKPAGQRARALETPTFADLVVAAGGADRVDGFCRRLMPEQAPKASPSARATRSPGAVTGPTSAAQTGKPTTETGG
ncbi:hypothetical protein GA0070624_4691 [Micromonospora rhizosphaerae]|uniref:Uncharacterized protein n=1 Tax=Micromonospora rhizosphaerae TaxID=568872 RepID=A0A1C6SV22_9ACTN|nr:hypothetical protein [Micromonospora rhizosphaerae]SCL33239.1 hypothetical protein GA0070624_4691 [Micromonospora rhizosphaerae]